jgi:outer membrane immunogenic protein
MSGTFEHLKRNHRMRISTIALAAVMAAGAAHAADLPSKKSTPWFVQVQKLDIGQWGGIYGGLSAGYSWDAAPSIATGASATYANPAFPAGAGAVAGSLAASGNHVIPASASGWTFGGFAGYRYQWNNVVVGAEVGLEGVFGGSAGRSTSGTSLAPWGFPAENWSYSAQASKSLDYLGTVKATAGYSVMPNLLVFVDGGLAFGQVNVKSSFSGVESLGARVYPGASGVSSFSGVKLGYVVGGGLEYAINRNWSVRGAYDYFNLGSVGLPAYTVTQVNNTAGGAPWGAAGFKASTKVDGHKLTISGVYRF